MFANSLAGLTLSLLAIAACGGGPAKPVHTASAQPEPITPIVPAAPAADASTPAVATRAPAPLPSRRILEYIPSEYDLVLHFNVDTLIDSEFFRRHERALLAGVEDARDELRLNCQFDPLLDVESVTLALNLSSGDPEVLFAIRTPVGASRVSQCVTATGGKSDAKTYTIDGDDVAYYWPTEDVVLLSNEISADEIAYALRTGRSLDNPALMEFLSRTDQHATMWGAGIIPPALASSMNGVGGMPRGFVIRGSAWAGLDLSTELIFDSRDEADKMMNLITLGLSASGQDPPFRDLLEAVSTQQMDTSIMIDAHISPELAGELVDEL